MVHGTFQVSDLRTLLEMYGGWQRQIAPRFEFGEFLDNLEELGSTNALKVSRTLNMHPHGTLEVNVSPGVHMMRPQLKANVRLSLRNGRRPHE